MYDLVLPELERRYRAYLDAVDPVLDGPSVVVIERILADLPRQRGEAAALRRERLVPSLPCLPLRAALEAAGPLVSDEAVRG